MEENHSNFEPDNEEQLVEDKPAPASDEYTDNNTTNEEIGGHEDGEQDVEEHPTLESAISSTERESRSKNSVT